MKMNLLLEKADRLKNWTEIGEIKNNGNCSRKFRQRKSARLSSKIVVECAIRVAMDLSKFQPVYRQKQIFKWIFADLIGDWEEAKNLPKDLRETLKRDLPLKVDAEMFYSKETETTKALITLEDQNPIETVLMRHGDGERGERRRNTVCVSCQVGCPMACDFCATGKLGLKRNLNSWEILIQILVFARLLKKENDRVSNVVFMGMGEPMLNYTNVMDAIHVLNDKDGLNIGARKMSISTCGLVYGIDKLAEEPLQVNLALSLHAPNDALREKIMPVNKQFSVDQVLTALGNYIQKTHRKVMIEYLLLKNLNDSAEQARELAHILKKHLGKLFMVNLIVYNVTGEKYSAPRMETKHAFRYALEMEGVEVTQRFRMGHDIDGACGQLAAKQMKGSAEYVVA